MRQIKFRAWRSDGEKMRMQYAPSLGYNEHVDINEQISCAGKNNIILMQFTGLLDKNGKEIWEGDIIQEIDEYPISSEERGDFGEIYWSSEFGGWMIKWKKDNSKVLLARIERKTEIIGNIYENPDLLNNK